VLSGSITGSTGVLDAGLVWGTSAAQLSTITGGTLAGVEQIGTAAGQLAGTAVFALPTTNPGDVDFINIIYWDASYGNTLAGALAAEEAGGWFGTAAAGAGNTTYGNLGTALSFTLGPTAGPGNPIYGTTAGFYGKSVVLTSPEPATIAIGGLGAAAMLLFRRRK
jgi:PEP-CTERM motif